MPHSSISQGHGENKPFSSKQAASVEILRERSMINTAKKKSLHGIATGCLNSLRNWFWKWSWALGFQLSPAYVGCPPRTLSEDKLPCLTLTRREGNERQNNSRVKTQCPWEQLEGESLPRGITAVYPWWAGTCSREARACVQPWEAHPGRENSTGTPADASTSLVGVGRISAMLSLGVAVWFSLGSLTGEDVLPSTQNSLENISCRLQ